MTAFNSKTDPAATAGPHCGHILEGAVGYFDAAMLELNGAKGLVAVFARASEGGRAITDFAAADALWAIVEKLEAVQHYANAAWLLKDSSTPGPARATKIVDGNMRAS